LRDPLGSRLAAADELRLMAKLVQDRVEHNTAERIVLDAQNAQRGHVLGQQILAALQMRRCRGLRADQGHREAERGPAAVALRHLDVATHAARELLDRGQSQSRAAEARRDRDIGLRERPEQAFDLFQRQADAAVRNRERDADLALDMSFGGGSRHNLERDAPLLGEFHRVVDQVFQRRAQPDGIADHERRQFFGNLDGPLQPLGRRPSRQRIAYTTCQRPQVEQVLPYTGAGVPASCRIDEQRRQARQMFGAGLDGIGPAPLAFVEVRRRQEIADGQNAGQRRADLMGECRKRRLDHARSRHGGALATRPGRQLPGRQLFGALLHRPLFGQRFRTLYAWFCRHGPLSHRASMPCHRCASHGRVCGCHSR